MKQHHVELKRNSRPTARLCFVPGCQLALNGCTICLPCLYLSLIILDRLEFWRCRDPLTLDLEAISYKHARHDHAGGGQSPKSSIPGPKMPLAWLRFCIWADREDGWWRR
ncbi:hypothetical protein BJX65DRAFT_234556 [Aspergillus insuetus]